VRLPWRITGGICGMYKRNKKLTIGKIKKYLENKTDTGMVVESTP
jgi:hypothetical protein